jgi:hypothetical protein
VSYSSPAAAALSVQSMPPTMVATANGSATGSFAAAACSTVSHHSPALPQCPNIASGCHGSTGTGGGRAGTSGTPSRGPSHKPA